MSGSRPEPKLQPMPLDRAILWNPPAAPGTTAPGRPSTRSPYPIFFQQEAVIALQDHLKSSPTQAIFGFLIGDVYRDPEAGVLYTVIDKTLKLSQPIYGDKTEVVVSRLWDRMQEQLKKASASLLGWYHSHPGQGGFLTAHDVETHGKFFTEPWHVAVLVAAEAGGVTGRFFRASQSTDWHKLPVAFYELLQPDSIKPDGKKRSFITWRNYKAYGPTLTGPKPAKPAPPPPPPKAEEPEEEPEAPAPPRPAPPPPPVGDKGFRIMRSSADDIPVIRSSADDEPAPAPKPEPPPPPAPPRVEKRRPSEPVFVSPADERSEEPPPAPPRPDTLPWTVTPESVASAPPPVIEPPREPRRTPTQPFQLLEGTPTPRAVRRARRRKGTGRWLRRLAVLLLIARHRGRRLLVLRAAESWCAAAVGRAAGSRQEVGFASWQRAPDPPAEPRTPSYTTAGSAGRHCAGAAAAASADSSSPPSAPPAPPAPASPFARFDRLSDSLSSAVRNYRDRAELFGSGRLDCGGLASGLVAIEGLWTTYNAERRARMTNFDQRRALRDQAMYASVDSVESNFEQSGCRRP